jgi:hypothetical protein
MTMDVEASVAQLKTMLAVDERRPDDEFAVFEAVPEVIAYLVALARQDGHDEVEYIEVLIKALDMKAADIRAVERVLRPLGYDAVAVMLRQLARRARRK